MENRKRDLKKDEELVKKNLNKIHSDQRIESDEGLLHKSDTSSVVTDIYLVK